MSWVRHHIQLKDGYVSYPPPLTPASFSTLNKQSSTPATPSPSSSGSRISPAVLFVIVILAVLFFISGLLHLLVRFLVKRPSSSAASRPNRYNDMSTSDALQRQLQQLFHLHDSGLDQAFIDALPVFQYKEIVGAKEPFDCAVCLCEFSDKDKLRLLPMCSHAFHINCIDTWLLSNSTCPLCRNTLFSPGFSMENPIFDFDEIREEDAYANAENGLASVHKSVEPKETTVSKGLLPVRLGKFRRIDGGGNNDTGGETSSSNLDARRCFSMGSYQYVLGNSDLKVSLINDHRRRDLKIGKGGGHNDNSPLGGETEGKKISNMPKGDSFSVSKIWLWSRKGRLSSDAPTGMPSLTSDLPWMREHRKEEQ